MLFYKNNTRNLLFLVGVILVFLYYVQFFILKSNSFINIHDGLDCELIFRVLINLPENSTYYNNDIIWQALGGIPRDMLISDLNISSFLFKIIKDPFLAYLINDFLARIVAFIGMFLLISDYIIRDNARLKYTLILALGFAFLGSNTIYGGMTIMGQPLLYWSILNIINNKSKYNYFLVLAYPFCSLFYLSGIFICILLFALFIIFLIKKNKNSAKILVCFLILSLCYLLIEYRLILEFFLSDVTSHRHERLTTATRSFGLVLILLRDLIFTTQYHTGKFITIPILFMILLTFLYSKVSKALLKTVSLLLILYCVILLVNLVFNYVDFEFFKIFQWDRFYFLLPCLLFIVMAQCIDLVLNEKRNELLNSFFVIASLSVLFISILFYNIELKNNIRLIFHKDIKVPTYSQFFDKKVFDQIKNKINKPLDKYKVVSIGLHPAVALGNGFFTADGYFTSYPLSYKKQFRQVISQELDKDPFLKQYYDNWGNRCYIFSSELKTDFLISKKNPNNYSLKNLEINTNYLLNKLKCKYIFSALKIDNYQSLSMKELGVFSNDESYWSIYVYEIIDSKE